MLRDGDKIILCTDGLHKIPENKLIDVIDRLAPQDAVLELIRLANNMGGEDNSTCIVLNVKGTTEKQQRKRWIQNIQKIVTRVNSN